MKVLTFSRFFPKGHPKSGQPTHFVEKTLNFFRRDDFSLPTSFIPWTENYATLFPREDYLKAIVVREIKSHTIRAGNRFSPGEMASLRVWSDKPYRSKQVEFAQVEVKNVYGFEIHTVAGELFWRIPEAGGGAFEVSSPCLQIVASHDGLDVDDFIAWFAIHPKKKNNCFEGQIICWNENINYI